MAGCFRKAAGAALIGMIVTSSAQAQQSEAAFYASRNVILVIAAAAGGGYDRWGRVVGRHIGKHIPGSPSVVPQNMPAGGGIAAAGHLYAVAPKDGSTFGILTRDTPLAPVMTPALARFDPEKMNWLGSPTTKTSVCISNKRAQVATLKDLFQKELIVGDTGAGTGTHVYPRALNGLFGTKFKVIAGFQNSVDVFLAMERGEVDGICESYDSINEKQPGWLQSKFFNAIVQGGAEPHRDLAGVPFVNELARNDKERAVLHFLYAGQGIGRPFVAPPDIPPARLKVLRDAFAATMQDPEFLDEARKMRFRVEPVSGEKLTTLIDELVETPRDVVDSAAQYIK
jgi:tripartite-type tricarboxylate transporter receptor subunit TctC